MDELEKIPNYSGWLSVVPIEKGWSSDKKFRIQTEEGEYLLRQFEKDQLEKKRKEFEVLQLVAQLDLNTPAPICCEEIPNSSRAYLLHTYVEGNDLSEYLPQASLSEQYLLGQEAGQALTKIHQVPIPSVLSTTDSTTVFRELYTKKKRQLQAYVDSAFELAGQDGMITYVQQQLERVPNRPACLLHGDFHVGNFVYQENQPLGIIDFDRWDIGDAYEEFYKIQLFSREVSPAFARGQMDGYFSNQVPQAFWEAQKLYTMHAALYSIIWALPYGEKDVTGMIDRFQQMSEDYTQGTQLIPKWYQELDAQLIVD
ncbi:hypothetical protein BAU15_01305 [Enterococcus sp. JM4C]|uniref:aminoglycoside phosphotransferase family protein n=1 Tax=Candidatus Enterococcus huntleyi TaxID=1857217 RepID=UPI00137B31C6|nr:aminoglycoside phosphotransferase family protein [Enterococcus sp. JM4C]KAF1299312.1 hypothetical protein BAU15_01305 [Enterococcus sp. JM4C]